MLFLIIINLAFILHTTVAEDDSDITKAMKEHEVIPDVINEGPKEMLKIIFDSGTAAYMGKELTPTQVQNPPQLGWSAKENTFYTLIFTEPDAPSRQDPTLKEWLHWLIVNIPEGNVTQGDVIFDYQGSGPDKASGFHRYVYLLFEQTTKLHIDLKSSPANSIEGRPKFSTVKFCEKYGLGTPVTGNFYLAQYDEYSEVLWAKLGLQF